jgi:phenylalanyl-tRNA synthetase beta chain
LNLHSPSSYRFERGLDPDGVDWASRRCCQLILEHAGGELAAGTIDVGREVSVRPPVTVRLGQIERVLGIQVPTDDIVRILETLGNELLERQPDQIRVRPPSWRRDLTREIDFVEEVARIHGYDKIPEDVAVPMWPSHEDDRERVTKSIRRVLTAAGFDEAITASLVPAQWSQAFSPWTKADPIESSAPMKGILADAPNDLGQAELIRRSLVPSLLEARRYNESVSNPSAELFEIAKVYLPTSSSLPEEQWTLGMVTGADFKRAKGVIEDLLAALHCDIQLRTKSTDHPLLESRLASELWLGDLQLGLLGAISGSALQRFGLRSPTTVVELRIAALNEVATLVPQYQVPSPYPVVGRDLNLIVVETLQWSDLSSTITTAGGELLDELHYQETYRDQERDGADKKRILFSFTLRADDRTLTNEEADSVRDQIVAACSRDHAAELIA